MLQQFCLSYNLPLEPTRFALSLLLSFPIGLILKVLITRKTHQTTINLINFILTSILTIFVFSTLSFILLLTTCLVVYFSCFLKISPSTSFIITFIILLLIQIKVQVYPDDEFIDFSSIMMIMIIKLTSFAFAYGDSFRDESLLDDYQKRNVVRNLPPLLDFLGYCFNIVGYFVGPGLEFKTYRDWCEGKAMGMKRYGWKGVRVLVLGIGLMALHLSLENRYHFRHVAEPWFASLTVLQKYFYITFSGIIVRAKFHAAWKVSESIGIFSGLGGDDGRGCENVDIVKVEVGENPKMMMDSWNKFTANWLRRYIYLRVPIPSLKLPLTFIVSAVWHGVYIGYYTTFISSVLLTESARAMRKSVRPVFVNIPVVYDIIGRVVSMSMMNYLVVSFILRDWDKVYRGWYLLGFYGHVGMVLTMVVLKCGGERVLKTWSGSPGKKGKDE